MPNGVYRIPSHKSTVFFLFLKARLWGELPDRFLRMVIGLVAHGQPLLPLLFPGLVIHWGGPQGAVSHWPTVLSTLQSVLKLYQPAHKANSPGGISRSAGDGRRSESFGSLGGEKRRPPLLPAGGSLRPSSATSRDSTSHWAWVGWFPTWVEISRDRAASASTLASRPSSRSSSASHSWGVGLPCPFDGFRRFNSSSDKPGSNAELTLHLLLPVLVFMEPVIPAPHTLGCGVGDILPAGYPADFIALAPHQGEEFLPAGGVHHTLFDGVHQPELPALPFGGGAVLPGVHPLLPDQFLRRRQNLQTVGGADLIIGQPVGQEVCGALVELSSIPEADAVHHQVVVEMLRVHMGGYQRLEVRELPPGQLQTDGVGLLGRQAICLREGLVLSAVYFAEALLGELHFREGRLGGAVPPGHQL